MEFYSAIGKKHIEKTIVADFSIPNKHYYQSIDLHRSPPSSSTTTTFIHPNLFDLSVVILSTQITVLGGCDKNKIEK